MVSPSPLDGGLNSRACLRILLVESAYASLLVERAYAPYRAPGIGVGG